MSARKTDSGLDGILAVDKPAGWTSHDVVAKVRGIVRQRRIGHTGTLDPMATGLLVLCLGQATRLVEYMAGHDKRYVGTVTLGITTTTDDAEGEVLRRATVDGISPLQLEAALETLRGAILQRPPAFSALKIGGRRAYDLARKGEVVELQLRPVTISSFAAEVAGPETLRIDVSCTAGTYIRSLARDLGELLGCGAHLSALRRVRVGGLDLTEALTIEQVQQAAGSDRLEEILLPVDDGVSTLDAAILHQDAGGVLANGGLWKSGSNVVRAAEPARIYDSAGQFIAVGSVSSLGEIRPLKVLGRPKR